MAAGGPGLAVLMVALVFRFRLSRARIQEFLGEWLGLKLSVGTIHRTLKKPVRPWPQRKKIWSKRSWAVLCCTPTKPLSRNTLSHCGCGCLSRPPRPYITWPDGARIWLRTCWTVSPAG